MALPDAIVSVWTPTFSTMYARDVSDAIKGGSYTYDAGGCGAGSLDTNLTWEQIYAAGYFQGRNGVEISMQDDVVGANFARGATKIYVTATAPYDPAIILEKMVIALWDGALLTVGIPVTGVGSDAGGPYITVGIPLTAGIAPGNPLDATLPAYGAGTLIYRRRWSGRIARRTRFHDNTTRKTSIALVGIGTRLKECLTNFTANGIDAGQALNALIFNCRDRLTDLNIAGLVMPNVGSTYSGTNTNAFVSDVITQILAAIQNGIWSVRIHSDRIPRLIKLWDQATNTYPHIINLSNHATHFVPISLQSDDEDTSTMYNAVQVTGNLGGGSSQSVTAADGDATSVTTYGQIDGAPQTVTGIKDQATAALIALGLLDQHAFPQSTTSFDLFVRNDWFLPLAVAASPSGLSNADVGSGFEAIYLAGFDETQSVRNRAIDSPIDFATGPLKLWVPAGAASVAVGAAPNGDNAWSIPTQAGGAVLGPSIPVAPGERIRIGGVIDTTNQGAGSVPDSRAHWSIVGLAGAVLGSAFAVPTVSGVQYLISNDIIVPANTYVVQFLCSLDYPDASRLSTAAIRFSMLYMVAGNQLTLAGASGNDVVNPTGAVDLSNWTAHQVAGGSSVFSHDNNPGAWNGTIGRIIIVARGAANTTGAYLDQPLAVEPGVAYTLTVAMEVEQDGTTPISADAGALVDVFDYATGAYLAVSSAVTALQAATGITLRFTPTNNVAWLRLRAYGTSIAAFFYEASVTRGRVAGAWNAPRVAANGWTQGYVPNHAAPNIYGLPTSVTCAFTAAGDRTQSFSFAPIEPDINASIAERAHAIANAILANTLPGVGLEQFVVSPEAGDYAYGPSALTVSFPSYLAIFAKGTPIKTITAQVVTLAPSGTTHVWIAPTGFYATRFNDPSNVAGAILIGYFTTNASGVIGDFRRASYGPLQAGAGKVNPSGTLPAPVTSGATSANGYSLNGLAADVDVVVPLTNVPSDGSATMVEFYYRVAVPSGSPNAWIAADGENLAYASDGKTVLNPSQTVSFSYGSMVKGATYDFGIAYRGSTGYGPITDFKNGHVAGLIAIGAPYLLGGNVKPTLPGGEGSATITAAPSLDGVTSTLRLAFTLNNQPTDGSLSRVTIYFHVSGANPWAPLLSVPYLGSSSGTYSIDVPDLTNGLYYAFAVAYENLQSGESDLAYLGTGAAQLVAIKTPYLLSGGGASAPAPSVSAVSVTPLPGVAGLSCTLAATFTISNQPTDGSLSRIALFMAHSGASRWSPFASIPVAGLPNPTASATYTVDFNDLTNGDQYGFACAFEDTQGEEGPLTQIGGAGAVYTAQPIAIAAHYLLGGTTITPTANAGYSVTNVVSANGITAAVAISCVLNNQPTDGSLSRVNFWYRQSISNDDATPGAQTPGSGVFYWTPAGGMPAAGVGSTPPPTSGAYVFVITDITGSQQFDFGVSYENAQGGESNVGVFVENFATAVIVISGEYLAEGSLVVPNVTGPNGTGAPQIGVAVPGQFTSTLALAFAITNQPTDGSLQKIILYYRKLGSATWLQFATSPPRGVGAGADNNGVILTGGATAAFGDYGFLYPEAANGTTFEFGVSVESNRGSESSIVSLGSTLKSVSAPSGYSFIMLSSTFTNLGHAPTGALNLDVQQEWSMVGPTASAADDFSWIDHFELRSGWYDGTNIRPGVSLHTEPKQGAFYPPLDGLHGIFHYSQTVQQNNDTSGYAYHYYYYWLAVAVDGTSIASSTVIFAHA